MANALLPMNGVAMPLTVWGVDDPPARTPLPLPFRPLSHELLADEFMEKHPSLITFSRCGNNALVIVSYGMVSGKGGRP